MTIDRYFEDALAKITVTDYSSISRYLENDPNSVNKQNLNGWTPLITAAELGNLEAIKYLLDKEANLLLQDNILGYTALHRAAARGNLAVMQILINKAASLDELHSLIEAESLDSKATPFLVAVQHGQAEASRLLLEKGATLIAFSHNNKTVFELALLSGLKDPDLLDNFERISRENLPSLENIKINYARLLASAIKEDLIQKSPSRKEFLSSYEPNQSIEKIDTDLYSQETLELILTGQEDIYGET